MRMQELIVSAASSLTDVLTELAGAFEKSHPGARVRINAGASGALLQQIRQGAPADVFISASAREIDALERENLLLPLTRANVAGNRLVLIAPKSSALTGWSGLLSPSVKRVALSDPDSVPSGRYAKETLVHRSLWKSVEPKAVYGESVRQTLAYVAAGDVDAGLVFLTDARGERRVRVVATAAPGKDHAPIVYPAAALRTARSPALAREFVRFLRSAPAAALFRRFGFSPPP